MTDDEPFANWPHLDKPKPLPQALPKPLPTPPRARLPGSSEMDSHHMASKNALENFLGGSPLTVAVRLFFVSLVVGALLMWLELRPMDILRGVQAFFDRIYQLGFGAVKELASYVLAGAVFVVPAWLILRLMSVGGR